MFILYVFYMFISDQADQPFHLRAEISPCHFNVYDTDKDGVISYDEMLDLVEDNDKDAAKQLFLKLDEATGKTNTLT